MLIAPLRQILFMVGRGFLKPDMEKLRTDTPKALRRLLDSCLSYARDGRPTFRNVSWISCSFLGLRSHNYFFPRCWCHWKILWVLYLKFTDLSQNPFSIGMFSSSFKTKSSCKTCSRTNLQNEDLLSGTCSSPKTPVNANLSSFTFASHVWFQGKFLNWSNAIFLYSDPRNSQTKSPASPSVQTLFPSLKTFQSIVISDNVLINH